MEYLEERQIQLKDHLQVLDLIRTQDLLQEQDLQQDLAVVLLDQAELSQDLLQDLVEVKQDLLQGLLRDLRLDLALHLEEVLIVDHLLLHLEAADQDLAQVQAEAVDAEDNNC